MSNLYSLIAFISLFAVALFGLDFSLPRKMSLVHEMTDIHGEKHFYLQEPTKEQSANIKRHRLVLKESTPILNLEISYTGNNYNIVQRNISTAPIYFPGLAFIAFLGIGAVFGLFFKKPEYLERRAAYYNLIIGAFVLLLYSLS